MLLTQIIGDRVSWVHCLKLFFLSYPCFFMSGTMKVSTFFIDFEGKYFIVNKFYSVEKQNE